MAWILRWSAGLMTAFWARSRRGFAEAFMVKRRRYRIERYIPQSLLLQHCDLVVTHGGHNTVLASLYEGLPLVLVPITADQVS